MYNEDEDSVVVEQHIPCEECGSSDGKCVYSDGHSYCYACQDHKFTDSEKVNTTTKPRSFNMIHGEVRALKARNITEETCKKYGYTIGTYSGKTAQIANYKKDGQVIGQKIRMADKQFAWVGEKNPPLWGQHLWKSGGKKLTILEGEIDTMSMSQAQDNKWACVSLPSGATSAVKSIKNNLEYVNSFDSVVLMFDSDSAGQKAAQDVAPLIAPGKCFIAALPLKDASEMLVAGRSSELISAMWGAIPYSPEGLINGADLFEEMNKVEADGLSYPWPEMTKALHGIRLQEIVVLIASTGIGKSQILKEIAYHLNIEHKKSLGLFLLEESNKITAQNLVGLSANIPLHLPEYDLDEVEKKKHFDKVFGHGRVHLFNKFGSADIEDIKSKMRYLAISCGVEYFFIDHMAAFAISKDDIADERKTIDVVIAAFAELVRELNVTMFLVSHINRNNKINYEEGGEPSLNSIRSSAGLAQWASQICGISRNQQSENMEERNISKVRVLKDRFAGNVGETFQLKYSKNTGRMTAFTPPEEELNPFKDTKEESTNDFTDF